MSQNNINLYHGDSLSLLKEIPDKSIRLLLQDLPYGITNNLWDKQVDLSIFWPEWRRVGMDDAAFLFFCDMKYASKLIQSNEKEFKYDLIWEKTTPTGFLNAKKQPLRAHELILVFYRSAPVYNPQKTHGHARKVSLSEHKKNAKISSNYGDYGRISYDSTDRYPRSVIRYSSDKQKLSIHPTQKPVDLLRYLIRQYSNMGEFVFDGFMGSGSTGVAAILEERRFIGAEINDQYFFSARERILDINDK